MSGNLSLMSLEDYHPPLAPDPVDSGEFTVLPSQAISGERPADYEMMHKQDILTRELDHWKRRFE